MISSKGYDPNFLGPKLQLPSIPLSQCASLKNGSGNEIKYTHYSTFLHRDRKMPVLCVTNIKGEGYNAPSRAGDEPWELSDQVFAKYQLDNDFYGNDNNTFDRGHIVRRIDPSWGEKEIADLAEQETFRWTNCTPQHKKLNQKGGAWFQLEQHVMENGVKKKTSDITVFAGPVLSNDDKFMKPTKGKYRDQYIQIPTEYWKVIVWKKSDNRLYAVGFLMSQWEFIKGKVKDKDKLKMAAIPLPDDYFEKLKFANHQTYQVPISVIEKKTGIKFNWPDVRFPYTTLRATAVKAEALTTMYTFVQLQNRSKHKSTGIKTRTKGASARLKNDENALTKAHLKRAIDKGYIGAIKQFSLKNIKL